MTSINSLRACFVLPGLHRVVRGAEVAFESIARELAKASGFNVTLIGSGHLRHDEPYRFLHAGCVPRERFERWPVGPVLRSDCCYEELSFLPGLLRVYRPADYDVTVACSYPFTNWVLRSSRSHGHRPIHVYVTQNGDWPVRRSNKEYRWFDCDGLICTNPEYYERHKENWPSVLIPNGVDPNVFCPGPATREGFGIPDRVPVVLMVSALIPSKRVLEGIRCVAQVPEAHLVVAGDGPLRSEAEALGRTLMGECFHRLTVPRSQMPCLYRAADVFLHMSDSEPFGNVYVESLAVGLPIIAHDWSLTRWMLNGDGLLIDTHDTQAVVTAIKGALRSCDSARQARRNLVFSRYTWRGIAAQYGEFLREACERAGRLFHDTSRGSAALC